jgi:hypothetical protein
MQIYVRFLEVSPGRFLTFGSDDRSRAASRTACVENSTRIGPIWALKKANYIYYRELIHRPIDILFTFSGVARPGI